MQHRFFIALISVALLTLQGCAGFTEKLSTKIADKLNSRVNRELGQKIDRLTKDLTDSMLDHDDPGTVVAGMPAYLILLDSMLRSKPNDQGLLMGASRLYSAYAGALVDEPERAKRLSERARRYAAKVLCKRRPGICKSATKPFDQFKPEVSKAGHSDIGPLYAYGVAWAGWLQARTEDWEALAEAPKIEYIFQHLSTLDERHDNGRVQLYLGIMRSQIPPSLGGKPETARKHFEKAVEFSGGKDLMIKVKFARHYARLVFNQGLHDKLIKEVLEADPQVPGLTLTNVMAQDEARKLKADDYF